MRNAAPLAEGLHTFVRAPPTIIEVDPEHGRLNRRLRLTIKRTPERQPQLAACHGHRHVGDEEALEPARRPEEDHQAGPGDHAVHEV